MRRACASVARGRRGGRSRSHLDRGGYTVYVTPKPTPTPTPVDVAAAEDGVRPSSSSGWRPPFVTPDPGTAQAIAYEMVLARGWDDDQFACLVALWNRNPGWRVNAYNASSGAYGIPQALPGSKMATAGADWETNPATQITWGLGLHRRSLRHAVRRVGPLRVRRLVLTPMPRSNRRRSRGDRRRGVRAAARRLEAHRDAARRRVDGAAGLGRSGGRRPTSVPGCGRTVEAGVAHLVAWRADGVLGDRGRPRRASALAHALLEDRLTWRSADPCCCRRAGRRSSCETLDELTLVGELALPVERDPVATLVTLHPLPTAGGFMDSHILRKSAARLPALADLAVLRFNTRGTTSPRGTSEGAVRRRRRRGVRSRRGDGLRPRARLPRPWLVGWSFGTEIALKYGLDHDVEGVILLSPPLHRDDAEKRSPRGRGLTAGHRARSRSSTTTCDRMPRPSVSRAVPDAVLIPVEGGKHLWVGENQTRRVLTEIVAAVNPDALPLPTEWDGPVEA